MTQLFAMLVMILASITAHAPGITVHGAPVQICATQTTTAFTMYECP